MGCQFIIDDFSREIHFWPQIWIEFETNTIKVVVQGATVWKNYCMLILSMSRDIRMLLVKLADWTRNMRTLQYMTPEKQRQIAKEMMEICAPLAHWLGIYWLKTELEDKCFKYLHPEKYQLLDTPKRMWWICW